MVSSISPIVYAGGLPCARTHSTVAAPNAKPASRAPMTISRLFMSLLLGLRVDHDTQCRLANRPLCLRRNRTVHQHRPLRRVPRPALPSGAGRARGQASLVLFDEPPAAAWVEDADVAAAP